MGIMEDWSAESKRRAELEAAALEAADIENKNRATELAAFMKDEEKEGLLLILLQANGDLYVCERMCRDRGIDIPLETIRLVRESNTAMYLGMQRAQEIGFEEGIVHQARQGLAIGVQLGTDLMSEISRKLNSQNPHDKYQLDLKGSALAVGKLLPAMQNAVIQLSGRDKEVESLAQSFAVIEELNGLPVPEVTVVEETEEPSPVTPLPAGEPF